MLVKQSDRLPGVRIFVPDQFEDFRGKYVMMYNKQEYGLPVDFVEDCVSTSRKGTLRGFHIDPICHKLISVLHGQIYYIVLDVETGIWESFILTGDDFMAIYKPPQYAAGFLALTDDVVFHYKQSEYYYPARQKTYPWNGYGIPWPVLGEPILSERDREAAGSRA